MATKKKKKPARKEATASRQQTTTEPTQDKPYVDPVFPTLPKEVYASAPAIRDALNGWRR